MVHDGKQRATSDGRWALIAVAALVGLAVQLLQDGGKGTPGPKGIPKRRRTSPLYEARAVIEPRGVAPHGPALAWDGEHAELYALLDELLRRTATDETRKGQAEAIRIEMLRWEAVRDLLLSGRVAFDFAVDPDDRHQLETLYDHIVRNTRVTYISPEHVEVTFRGPSPDRNEAIVNGLIRRYVSENRQRRRNAAKEAVKYCNDKLAVAKNSLHEVDARLREFDQANPLLASVAELEREFEAAQEAEKVVRKEVEQAGRREEAIRKRLESATGEARAPIEAELDAAREALDALSEKRLQLSKKVREYFVAIGRAPELLASRRAQEEEQAALEETVEEYARLARGADRMMSQVLSETCSRPDFVVMYGRANQALVDDPSYVPLRLVKLKRP